MTSPGYLKGEAVAAIVAALHSAHGTWHLIEARPVHVDSTELVFAVGAVYPEQADERERVHVLISRR